MYSALQWCMDNADEFIEEEYDQNNDMELENAQSDGEMEIVSHLESLTEFTQNLLSRSELLR